MHKGFSELLISLLQQVPYTNDLMMFGKMENTQSGLQLHLSTEN